MRIAVVGGGTVSPTMAVPDNPETSVCGFVREPLAFWLFRRAAGSPDAQRVAGIGDIDRIRGAINEPHHPATRFATRSSTTAGSAA